jgi:glycerol-3-phosphate cytidylyltransferase
LKIYLGGKQVTRVITYGTFDLLHYGHINILRRAKELGDHLTVAVSSDEFNAIKNKKSYYNYENRKLILESIRYVDKVIPEHTWDQKIKDVIEHNIDIFVMGDDWKGEFDFLNEYCHVIYLPRTAGISTTKIKKDLFAVSNA